MDVDALTGAFAPVTSLGLRLPTPLDARPDMGGTFGDAVGDLYIKREDLIDDLGTGHKSRKLAYVAADAQRLGADVLVTGGSVPSSQCVAVAAIARQLGIRAHLVYSGDTQAKPTVPSGNYLLALLLDPTITWFENDPWSNIAARIDAVTRTETSNGMRPYAIAPGLDSWPGLLGSMELGHELAAQLAAAPLVRRTHVVAAAGSGTTCLGLSICAELLDLPWTIHGMCFGAPQESVRASIERLTAEFAARSTSNVRPRVRLYDTSGTGYDLPTDAELDEMARALQVFKLPLDPNYMVKTFRGIGLALADQDFHTGDRIVLVHSGGSLGLVGGTSAIRSWLIRAGRGANVATEEAALTVNNE